MVSLGYVLAPILFSMVSFNVAESCIIFDNAVTHLAYFTRASIVLMLTHNFYVILPGESRL
jgi:hypothetical protein